MLKIENNRISLTRGDSMAVFIDLYADSGEPWEPQEGDTVKFALKSNKFNCNMSEFLDHSPLIQKDISTSDMVLRLVPADTKSLGFGNYVYDIEVTFADGFVDTPINDVPFKLLPEVT